MKISDILGMSLGNLWRRKMRTVLTVLGVVIGTASIVVMLSLGIGLKESMMAQVGSASSLTQIWVYSDDSMGEESMLLDDTVVETMQSIQHVDSVNPQVYFYMPLKIGNYETYVNVIGITDEEMREIELGSGDYPTPGNTLTMVAGNQIITDLMDSNTGQYIYWETGELPNVDLLTAPVIGGIGFQESIGNNTDSLLSELNGGTSGDEYYDSTFSTSTDFGGESDDLLTSDPSQDMTDSDSLSEDFKQEEEQTVYSAFTDDMKRVSLKISGVTEGDVDTYTDYSYACYVRMDDLKKFFKQYYPGNSVIPGQPLDKTGKPYRTLKYSQITVNVDESVNVEEVQQMIQDMGYRADANKEWLEEIEKEFMIIEAVLGGIGAVAMLVAAISIANTMTMSTYERTKEIGVMKVLGCSLGNIRSMFLAEAAFIGLLGGVAGIGLSYTLSMLANKLIAPMIMMDYGSEANISVIPIWLVGSAIVFATIIGMLAGFFPAQRATKLSPLAAIRNE